jgi:DNA replication protein DnaC
MSEALHEKIIGDMLKELHLSAIRECFVEKAREAATQRLSPEGYLKELLGIECAYRRQKSIERRLHESNLPMEKTFETFELDRFDRKLVRQVEVLRDGSFLNRRENVLAFGSPGSGKSHLLSALGHELIRGGYRVSFTSCSLLVQELLRVKSQLQLDRHLKKLSKYDALIIDDIGYVQQSRDEMEVLFTLLAVRYERGSVLLTSNLSFSKWESIFKDPMTTAAAIDRLVHHSVILELNVPSFRMQQAQQKIHKGEKKNGDKSSK